MAEYADYYVNGQRDINNHSCPVFSKNGANKTMDTTKSAGNERTSTAATIKAENKDVIPNIANQISGNWSGDIVQGRYVYKLQLTADYAKSEFKISYPSLGCSGSWIAENVSDKSADFQETHRYGQMYRWRIYKNNND